MRHSAEPWPRYVAVFIAFAILALFAGGTPVARSASPKGTPPALLVDFTADDESVREALLRLGKQTGVNIVVMAGVEGRVSVSLHRATLDQALIALTRPLGYRYQTTGAITIVSAPRARSRDASLPASPALLPSLLSVTTIPVDTAASVLRGLYSRDRITVDHSANALIVVAVPDDIASMRAVLSGIDVTDPTKATTEAITLHLLDPKKIVASMNAVFPRARLAAGPNRTLIVSAVPQDMAQIKAIVVSMDTPQATPAPTTQAAEAVRVIQARPSDVVRAVANEYPSVRASVVGSSVVVSGSAGDVAKAKALIALIDVPAAGTRFTQVYRLRAVDAKSVGDLISKSFRDANVAVDADLNALSVTATASEQQRIADAIAQLDVAPAGSGAASGAAQPGSAVNAGFAPGGNGVEVVSLKSAIPGQNLAASTSATDLATAVTQALQANAPDLHITVPNNSTQLVLTGSPASIRLAKQLIDQLDVSPPQIVLDTEVLELDETGQKNVGLLLPPALSATYSEIPPVSAVGGTPPPVLGIQPWTRTTLSAQVVLNALMTYGHARVLADPRITTISGHTASIRAGDTLNFTTSVINGNVGSVVTQQVQSVQTGVTLDITPVVNVNNSISVTLHPTVNSLLGTNAQGVPSIANREAQTTVTLGDNQTLVIGGLIQENASRTETSVPILGQIPLIGRLFRNYAVNNNRNELIIVVTPHILGPNAAPIVPGPALPAIPTPEPLPTLPPGTALPAPGTTPVPLVQAWSTPGSSPPSLPIPTPAEFAQANEFHYGSVPANTYAAPGDPPQIFYALFSPTVLQNAAHVTLSVIATTNVSRVTIGYGSYLTALKQVAPDKWQASFAFSTAGFAFGTTSLSLALTASRRDGSSAVVQIPVSITP